ncbi:SCP2 sterol-binding domain-containing protein [Psychromonas sp. SP041]|uniref:SCP2 sterol-binding domain-containing protein n=1 Tax=Psychromonas sp. SP041 TaxID=1365007 RepID=UPI0004028DEB|nr:SCP2 sterol-binding domain-containing protein [Psychromonas sp. SP041]
MKKIIILTALKLIPITLQSKAICKALNYLSEEHNLTQLESQVIKLNVSDLKRNWFVIYEKNSFKATRSHKANVEVTMKLEVALNFQDKVSIINALEQEKVKFKGEDSNINTISDWLYHVDEYRLINLSNRFFSFLKIKSSQPPRLDVDTVSLEDLKNSLDIDFIRDEAVKLEKVNLEKALSLMSLAYQARPGGLFIEEKVIEYKKALNIEL